MSNPRPPLPPRLPPPPPLEYERVQPRRPIHAGIHVAIAIHATAYMALPMLLLILVVPRFEAVFRDFRTELPWITKLVLYISRWAANEYGWMFVLPLIVALVVPGLLLDLRGTSEQGLRIYRRVARLLLMLAMLVVSGVIILACFMPMISLIDSVSGARK